MGTRGNRACMLNRSAYFKHLEYRLVTYNQIICARCLFLFTMHGYQHSPPFESGFLQAGHIHRIHYEQYGNKSGKPVIFLHGGPGEGTDLSCTRFFNPNIYHVVLFDQRGAGKSIPNAELLENTTQHLIDDIENLRKHLHMDKWHMVFGGSWGSTLALAYAEQFPTVCGSLVLRGIFCGQQSELDWIFKDGAAKSMFPEEFDNWLQFLPEQSRSNPVPAYLELLQSKDNAVSNAAGRAWNRLELSLVNLISSPDAFDKLVDEEWIAANSRLEAHYFAHQCFLKPGQLLAPENLQRIAHIPGKLLLTTSLSSCLLLIEYSRSGSGTLRSSMRS